MKKMILSASLALCASVALFAADAGKVINANLQTSGAWSPKEVSFVKTFEKGIVSINVKTNKAKQTNPFNIQFMSVYNGGFKAGVKYQVSITVKADNAFPLEALIQMNKPNWTSLNTKRVNLAKGVAQTIVLDFSVKADTKDSYRVPMLALGSAPAGTKIEISNLKFVELK